MITFIQKHNQTPLKITASTHKLLKICTLALTSQNTYKSKKAPKTLVKIPLEQYMELCGMPLTASSKDYARKKVKKDLQVLFHISLEWNGPKGFSKMRLCGGVGIKNNIIMFDFYPPLARHLINAYVMQYPLDILKIDERNQYAYYVAEKLALHYSIDNNYLHSTHNIISFQALLEAIPGLPSYEEVAAKDRHIDLRIISPVQNALDSLDFITWYPCNKRKQPLTKEQLQNFDYHTFINTYVCFEILGYPEEKRQKRLESKKQKIEKAKSKKQKFISGKG